MTHSEWLRFIGTEGFWEFEEKAGSSKDGDSKEGYIVSSLRQSTVYVGDVSLRKNSQHFTLCKYKSYPIAGKFGEHYLWRIGKCKNTYWQVLIWRF